MRRKLFTLAAGVSAVLCAVTLILWAYSYLPVSAPYLEWGHPARLSLSCSGGSFDLRVRSGSYYGSDWWPGPVSSFHGFAHGKLYHAESTYMSFWQAPCLALALLLSVLPARFISVLLGQFLRASGRRRLAARGRCPACGYDLCATPDRCPECGAVPVGEKSAIVDGTTAKARGELAGPSGT
jgi:hypothetical protein